MYNDGQMWYHYKISNEGNFFNQQLLRLFSVVFTQSPDKGNITFGGISINSSPPSAGYVRRRIGPVLIQVMACRLFGAKPLSKTMQDYCQLDADEQTSVKF